MRSKVCIRDGSHACHLKPYQGLTMTTPDFIQTSFAALERPEGGHPTGDYERNAEQREEAKT